MTYFRWLMALLLLAVATTAQAQSFPPLSGRVVDAAGLLNPAQVAQLTAQSEEIEKASSRQFVVATIPDLQDYPIEDYGYKLLRAWRIGQKDANNGIILIIAPKERRVRIEVGYGLEPIMTDALASTIISDTILPRFKAGDMPGGIIAGANAIAEQMKLPLEAAEARAAKLAPAQKAHRSKGSGGAVAIFWVLILLFFIVPMLFRRAGGRRYRGGGLTGSGVGDVLLWTAINSIGNSGRSSGWGGGSDWGGGGGGGFSGGGGSGGGGGASGGW